MAITLTKITPDTTPKIVAPLPGEWMLRTNDVDDFADWLRIHVTPTRRWDTGNPDCGC